MGRNCGGGTQCGGIVWLVALFVPACRAQVFGHASACVPHAYYPNPLLLRFSCRWNAVCRADAAAAGGRRRRPGVFVAGRGRSCPVWCGVIHEASRCEGAI